MHQRAKSRELSALIAITLACFAGLGCRGPKPAPVTPKTETPAPASATPPVEKPAPAPAAPPAAAEKATLYRDTWGVPHIYADSDKAAEYAFGYAQAEDRLTDIYRNVRIATGTAAEIFGQDFVQADMAMQILDNAKFCESHWDAAPAELKSLVESFAAGVNAYVAEHPGSKPSWAADFQPWHCAAIGRALILKWPLGNVFDDYGHRDKTPVSHSNEWSVSPSRTADGCAILLTDPHVGWDGIEVFYEARVHGAALHMNGYFIVGSPLLGFGHTENVGWAPTTGGPDTGDVFTVKLDISNKLQPKYELNGEWKPAKVRFINIKVKDGKAVTQPTADTELGPVIGMDEKEGVAYIAASPYFDQTGMLDQSYKMCTAKNAQEFYDAVSMLQLMDQNLMFADRDGNIQYVRNGRTPVHPDGFDWNKPVAASTASMWKGIHSIADLVQIKNPPQGYMQNCNISPANMMVNSSLTPDKYPKDIYNVSWDVQNPRSRRLVPLLDSDSKITKEKAMSIATDVTDVLSKPWQNALSAAIKSSGTEQMKDDEFAAVVKTILDWDGQYTLESLGTNAFWLWRMKCTKEIDVAAIADGKPVPQTEQLVMLALLDKTIKEMKERYGKALLPWGEVHRVGRGGKFFPTGGADFGGSTDAPNMSETLWDVRCSEDPNKPGYYVGDNGTQTPMLMFFKKDGIESYTCNPWGESSDPNSPHYMDQGEQLYSKRQLKPTWFKKEDVLAHKESEKTISVP